MTLATFYWILVLLWALYDGYVGYNAPASGGPPWIGRWLLFFLILVVIGLRAFGTPLRG